MTERETFEKAEVQAASEVYFGGRQGQSNPTLAANVFVEKYALRDQNGVYYERTPADMHWRMAREFARIEERYLHARRAEEIFSHLDNFAEIVPQGSPMFGIGNTFQLVSTSNCKVLPAPQDNMSDIFNVARDMANLYKRRAGVGTDLSELRPAGAPVNNAAITSTGAWSFAEFFSHVTRMVGQSGRRGALMLSMDVRHPDIEKFIEMKKDLSKVTGANVSVKVTDDFMRAVEADEEYTLRWPVNALVESCKITRTVRAREIFTLIAETACATAEPGVLFWDTIERNLPLNGYRGFGVVSTNPCGEIPLCPYDSCRLISIYLANFVRNEFTAEAFFDVAGFEDVTRMAMRLSDDLVDLEAEKLTALRDKSARGSDEYLLYSRFLAKCRDGRRTGLGTHGLADTLARLGIRYDSEEGIEMARVIYRTLKLSAYRESVELAKQRGAFPLFDPKVDAKCEFIQRIAVEDPALYADMQANGRRNGAILTNAPTGSTSIMSFNCSSGVEPVFANKTKRRRKVDPARENVTPEYVDAQGDAWVSYELYNDNITRYLTLAYKGAVDVRLRQDIYIPEGPKTFEEFQRIVQLPDYFVTSADIDWSARVKMQAAIQEHIDHSISSTLNLPSHATAADVAAIYMEAWQSGCKGVTVYRDGSRDAQVLTAVTEEPAAKPAPETPKTIPYWPYCEHCKQPFAFEKEEPFAYCECGTTEWGDPRPASYVERPQTSEGEIYRLSMELGTATSEISSLRKELAAARATFAEAACTHLTTRGRETQGSMFKASFRNSNSGSERKVYVYVGTNADSQPVEAFVVDEQGDEELRPYATALGKLTSLLLKHGISAEEVGAAVKGLRGGSLAYEGGIYESVPDLLGKLLQRASERHMAILTAKVNEEFRATGTTSENVILVNIPTVPPMPVYALDTGMIAQPVVTVPKGVSIKGFSACPSCKSPNLRLVDGCPSCADCGWAKCA
jgi:ribonucleoside-diphosphate reductase alpha chain